MSKFPANCVQRSRSIIPVFLLKRMCIQNITPEGIRKDILQIHRKKRTSNNAKAARSIPIWEPYMGSSLTSWTQRSLWIPSNPRIFLSIFLSIFSKQYP